MNPRAGVSFFDGFYYEESTFPCDNIAITSGRKRGEVCRGHLVRGEARSRWLLRLHRLMGGPFDAEWTETAAGERVLLQVRPALFPIKRCETLSLANNKETLGDPPSPWIVSVYSAVGHPALGLARCTDTSLLDWEEPYSITLAGRAWVNFSSLFRLMDHWGLPRTLVSQNLGRSSTGLLDGRFLPGPFLRSIPALIKMAVICLLTASRAGRDLRRLDDALGSARSLSELWGVNVLVHQLSIRDNFALIAVASTASRLRRWLGVQSTACSVTRAMMQEYSVLAAQPTLAARRRGLEEWLVRHGYRGPHETDPAQPRFSELKETLLADLASVRTPAPSALSLTHPPRKWSLLSGLCHWENRREWFRDELMRRTQRLRRLILKAADDAVASGLLDRPEDVFFLTREALDAHPGTWREFVARSRNCWEIASALELPSTASRNVLEETISNSRCVTTDPGPAVSRASGWARER